MSTPDLTWKAPADVEANIKKRLAAFRNDRIVERIWSRDKSVWSGADEDRWLGWLDLPGQDRSSLKDVQRFADEAKAEGIRDVVLLGMGGSSLAPEVIGSIVGDARGFPKLHVLDSTDPAQILRVERAVDFERTLFLVASKSGSTLEVNILKQYFHDRAVQRFGAGGAGRRFVLTTDPGSKLQAIAGQEGFRKIFMGVPSVGGRFSALSNFGLVPAALIGVDVSSLLGRAQMMAERCRTPDDNAAFELGVVLGELALNGRDKPTLITSRSLASFGSWMEQLVAESLGKEGKGIIPIDGEPPDKPEVYGNDRVFVHLQDKTASEPATDALVDELERAGHPVIRIMWADRQALGSEFFRWEFATAVAGAVLGVNPFDQPDVEAAKVVTRRLAAEYETTGTLPGRDRISDPSAITELIAQLVAGDYFALLAFVEMNARHRESLDGIRLAVRDRRKVATTVGFGPRYLHSTGQAHKGGPNTGVFVVITAEDGEDMIVPGQKYTFGTIKLAQALGDFEVLVARGRRAIRIHVNDVGAGLEELRALVSRTSQ
jgi:transaldolase/glucose-6-phosphate isomerase